ncbi:hypothetical protein ACFQ3W_01410 [Paenibacillus puldeungensis]|uniref:Condensation domain-containing protein n=1 Tax=Paenibacillus puldeungensis TaxID=696536 RepID=A0ABW3RTD1_9BACL
MGKVGRIKAESFDLMQYFYRTVHEPLIHGLITFYGHLDEAAFIEAVTLSGQAIPLIRCTFEMGGGRPYWKDRGFTGKDIVHVMESQATYLENEVPEWLAASIDIHNEPQLKIVLIKGPETDTLCIIMNHMVCDGAGFKQYIYLLGELYTACCGEAGDLLRVRPDTTAYSRGTGQLFSGLRCYEKIGLLFAEYDLSKQKKQATVHMEGDSGNPFFVMRRMDPADFCRLKERAKRKDATINDMILTSYARALSRETGAEQIVIPCPVDLRKFIPSGGNPGICNLTSNFICDVTVWRGDLFEMTLEQVSSQMKVQKESPSCLKSVIMLEMFFHLLPFRVIRKVFGKLFTIPVTSYTNLGVIDKRVLRFGQIGIADAVLTGAIKYAPYFQIAVSTYDDACTLSCNLHSTPHDQVRIERFLEGMISELLEQ